MAEAHPPSLALKGVPIAKGIDSLRIVESRGFAGQARNDGQRGICYPYLLDCENTEKNLSFQFA